MAEAAHTSSGSTFNLGRISYVLLRHRRAIVLCTVLGVVGMVLVFLLTPNVYRSEGKLLVRYIMDTSVLDASATGGRMVSPDRYGDNIINSEVEILASRDLAEQAVDEIGVEKFREKGTNQFERFDAVLKIVRNLHIDVPKRSSILHVFYDGSNPTLAQSVLSSLIDNYLKKHIEIHRSAGAYDFLSQQTDQIRARLSDTEEELRKLKNDAGIVSVDETKRALIVRIEDLNHSLQTAEGALAATRAKMRIIHPMMEAGETTSASLSTNAATPGYARTYEQLARLQDKEMELLSTYTADSIPVANIRAQIDSLKQALGDAGPVSMAAGTEMNYTTNAHATLLEDEADKASLEAQILVLRDQIEEAKKESRKLDEIEGRVALLERNKDIQIANYKNFSQSLEQARIDDALDSEKISNISIVQPASYPAEKLRPDLGQNMTFALLLGLVCGIGFAFLHENFIDHTVRRPTELEEGLGIPLLLSIPFVSGNGKTNGQARKLLGAHKGAAEADGPGRHVPEGLRDYYDALGDRLLGAMGPRKTAPCVIGVTSCSHGAGVTTTAAGLAISMARNGEDRVLLVDADPSAGPHKIYGVNQSGGLVDIVADNKGNTSITEHNLYLLNPGEGTGETNMKLSRRFHDVVDQVKKSKYAYVIMDLPPVTDTSSTLRIAAMLNSVVLVLEAEKDHRDAARRARDLLVQVNAQLTGAVLNKTRSYVPAWLHPGF